jgi:hypothetical protein
MQGLLATAVERYDGIVAQTLLHVLIVVKGISQ